MYSVNNAKTEITKTLHAAVIRSFFYCTCSVRLFWSTGVTVVAQSQQHAGNIQPQISLKFKKAFKIEQFEVIMLSYVYNFTTTVVCR